MSDILIRFVGHAGIREIENYRWDPENNHVCPVDVETAANLLTYPRPDFHLVKGQRMSPALQKKLAELLGIDVSEIKVLVETVDTKPPKPASREAAPDEAKPDGGK